MHEGDPGGRKAGGRGEVARRMSRTGDGGSGSGFDDCWGESGRGGDWRPASEVGPDNVGS